MPKRTIIIEVTEEERRAIRALKRLAKTWPMSLGLFAGDGDLHVMRLSARGEFVFDTSGAVDQEYVITTIDIPCDGGGW